MTTKELFENLLAGKKMRCKNFDREYKYMVLKDDGIYCVTEDNDEFMATIYPSYYDSDWQEYKEEILDKKEKEYLSAVIKPFRDKIKGIYKDETIDKDKECIHIYLDDDYFILPYFEPKTMYKDMKLGKKYTLEELGL